MGFLEAIGTCLRQYARFKGRASRSEFWWFYLFTVLVEIAAVLVGGMLVSGSVTEPGMMSSMHGWYVVAYQSWLSNIVHLVLILPSLAVAVRRLHDVGRSGWWLLIGLVPFGIFVLLFWWVQPSAREANAHGLPPLPAAE